MDKFTDIKGFLIDLEGVIYSGDDIIEGAIRTLEKLNTRFKIRYLTNTTTTSRKLIYQKLKNFKLPLIETDVFSPSIAVTDYLKNKDISNIYLLANSNIRSDFNRFIFDDQNPQAIILGDIYKDFNWDNLNKTFELLIKNETILVALHKNRYCKRNNQISLDLGPFVSALEYASSQKAVVIGKPEKTFFDLAISSLGFNKDEIIMIGDDIIADIGGAKSNNIKAIQVKTGKYQPKDESNNIIQPDYRIDSIADLLFI